MIKSVTLSTASVNGHTSLPAGGHLTEKLPGADLGADLERREP